MKLNILVEAYFGIQRFSFGRILESKPSDLALLESKPSDLALLESNASALGIFWSPTLQLWAFFGVQRFSFGKGIKKNENINLKA